MSSQSITAMSNRKYRAIPKQNRLLRMKSIVGWFFVFPWIAGLIIFYVYPIVSSFYYSLTSYSILTPGEFVGLDNYKELMKDRIFWKSIANTIYYVVFYVPVSICFGVVLALLLNVNIRGMGIYRTIFFIPSLVPHVATAIVWMWLLNPQFGLVNSFLSLFGIDGPPWIGSEFWSKPSLILMSLWGVGHAVVIYLAGLQDIPKECYDAASVDGAGWLRQTVSITLPLLTPVIFYNLVMGIIGAFQQFTLPYSLTGGTGEPANSLMFYVMYLYINGFQYLKMGYASAMAWILFILIVILTSIVFYTSRKWVHYQGH